MSKESDLKKAEEKLSYKNKNGWEDTNNSTEKQIFKYSDEYKDFMHNHKTEREVYSFLEEYAKKNRFKNIEDVNKLTPGSYYFKFRNKAIAYINIPVDLNTSSDNIFNVTASHIDAPRLDLKPNPMKEDSSTLIMKSHYYGGIKKYQWVNTPMALHGVISSKSRGNIKINIGEEPDEPKFMIPDLLPHLGKEQVKKEASKVVEGEEMGLIIGHIPFKGEVKSKIKYNILKMLNKKYGIEESDLISSELCFVPAAKPSEIGFDKGILASYAHDDRVCAYASFKAFKEIKNNSKISCSIWFDKEETGSMGDTGAQSFLFEYLFEQIIKKANLDITLVESFIKTNMFSCDVTAAVNPNYKSVHDESNSSYLGHGVTIEKYGGSRGKYNTNDASAEYMRHVINILEEENIPWQTGELGKIDAGGGGTIAMFFSNRGMQVVDIGPPVIGMHSPCEMVSKLDIFNTYKAYKAFLNK